MKRSKSGGGSLVQQDSFQDARSRLLANTSTSLRPSAPTQQSSNNLTQLSYSTALPAAQPRTTRDYDGGVAGPGPGSDALTPSVTSHYGSNGSHYGNGSAGPYGAGKGGAAEEEAHPRGHEGLQKRMRLLVLRIAHRVASIRVKALAALLGGGYQYAVYLDGGSSGTRVHVFKYAHQRWPRYASLDLPQAAQSVEPGLSAYAGRPTAAAQSLAPLVRFALAQVPEHLWHVTPVFLLATAGLRLLTAEESTAILHACSEFLLTTPFVHKSDMATVISGDMEGVYAWTAANYVAGALEEASAHHSAGRKELTPHDQYLGVLELGGASFQISFVPNHQTNHEHTPHAASLAALLPGAEAASGGGGDGDSGRGAEVKGAVPLPPGIRLPLPGVLGRVFTHSYLGLGMDSAMQTAADAVMQRALRGKHKQQHQQKQTSSDSDSSVGTSNSHNSVGSRSDSVDMTAGRGFWDACLPSGYKASDGRQGKGDFTACLELVQSVLPERVCNGGDSQLSQRRLSGNAARGTQQGEVCSFAGVHLPPVSHTHFLAIENFYWTAAAIGLGRDSTLKELRRAAEKHCARPWHLLHAEYSGHVPDRLGIPEDQRILHFTNTIRRTRLHGRHLHEVISQQPQHTQQPAEAAGSPPTITAPADSDADSAAEVGLSWVVGAMLLHAMSDGAARHAPASADDHAAHRGDATAWRWRVFAPTLVVLIVLLYVAGTTAVRGVLESAAAAFGAKGLGTSSSNVSVVAASGGTSGRLPRPRSLWSVVVETPPGS